MTHTLLVADDSIFHSAHVYFIQECRELRLAGLARQSTFACYEMCVEATTRNMIFPNLPNTYYGIIALGTAYSK